MAPLFHPHIANVLGIITLAIWLHLFFGRGWFWRVRKLDADRTAEDGLAEWPSVMAIVPARNEAETIGRAIASLVEQDYPGELLLTVVDDHSEDATAAIARQVAEASGAGKRVKIVTASALAAGWTGKVWALKEGVSKGGVTDSDALGGAAAEAPSFYWFTDADVSHAPDTLWRLVVRAARHNLDLTSLMVLLQAKTLPERALIPAFLYFFLMLYPPQWIADEELSTAGAAGGCILLKRETLSRIGGLAAIRGEVIDDCALAKAVKASGGQVWMGLTRKSTSLRVYGRFAEIRDLIARTAFTQLRYSALLLAETLAGMFLTYVAPLVLLFAHDSTARILGFASWLLMSLSFLPTVRFYRLSPFWAPFLPLIALFYTYGSWLSAVRFWMGKGGQWKGRAQAPKGV
ncbi:MAG TPA: glycosyltransferase [Verrucomicrobiae bacterium]|jgi:hopene-associated glycosyltransferase HpnB|nr:glycosyltransferase [Verrucomicrobiae bacterium]